MLATENAEEDMPETKGLVSKGLLQDVRGLIAVARRDVARGR